MVKLLSATTAPFGERRSRAAFPQGSFKAAHGYDVVSPLLARELFVREGFLLGAHRPPFGASLPVGSVDVEDADLRLPDGARDVGVPLGGGNVTGRQSPSGAPLTGHRRSVLRNGRKRDPTLESCNTHVLACIDSPLFEQCLFRFVVWTPRAHKRKPKNRMDWCLYFWLEMVRCHAELADYILSFCKPTARRWPYQESLTPWLLNQA